MTQDQRLTWIQKLNVCAVRPCADEGPSTSTLLDSQSTILCSSTAASDPSINFQEEDSSKEKDPLNSFHEEDPFFPESDITVGHFSIVDGQSLSVSVEEGIANTHLPKPTAEGIWKKAAMLLGEEKAIIVPAPEFGPNDKMVKSKSGATPHLVTVAKRSDTVVQYKCDSVRCNCQKSIRYRNFMVCTVCMGDNDMRKPRLHTKLVSTFI